MPNSTSISGPTHHKPIDTSKDSCCSTLGQVSLKAAIITSLVVGLLATILYTTDISVILSGTPITTNMAIYTMAGGFSFAAIAMLLSAISTCQKESAE